MNDNGSMTLILLLALMISGSFTLAFQFDNQIQIRTINTLKQQNQLTKENIMHLECRNNIDLCQVEIVKIEIVEQLIESFITKYQFDKVKDANKMQLMFKMLPDDNPPTNEEQNLESENPEVEVQEPEPLVQYHLVITRNFISLIKDQEYIQRWLIEH